MICPICLESLDPEGHRVLRCCHTFHPTCMEQWEARKKKRTTCPVCRAPLYLLGPGETGAEDDEGPPLFVIFVVAFGLFLSIAVFSVEIACPTWLVLPRAIVSGVWLVFVFYFRYFLSSHRVSQVWSVMHMGGVIYWITRDVML